MRHSRLYLLKKSNNLVKYQLSGETRNLFHQKVCPLVNKVNNVFKVSKVFIVHCSPKEIPECWTQQTQSEVIFADNFP